jgi:NDP-sugar pyrophosphorylase family protein
MTVALLAAGLGTRLGDRTARRPKLLVPVGGVPLLERQLAYLAHAGVTRLLVNLHHFAEQVAAALERLRPPIDVRVSREPELLGTAGALEPFAELLAEPFVVLYGDVLTDVDLAELLAHQETHEGIATIVCHRAPDVAAKGVVTVRGRGLVTRFEEKPARRSGPGLVSSGVYALDPSILRYVRRGADFGYDVWPAAIAAGERVHAYEHAGYVIDVGTPAGLELAEGELREPELA